MSLLHFNIVVTGKVQGVYYRASTSEQANWLEIKGFVRNRPDGSVYIEAEGDEQQLSAFTNWCKIGPSEARVENISITAAELKHYTTFETRY